jgi:hypothetical protein
MYWECFTTKSFEKWCFTYHSIRSIWNGLHGQWLWHMVGANFLSLSNTPLGQWPVYDISFTTCCYIVGYFPINSPIISHYIYNQIDIHIYHLYASYCIICISYVHHMYIICTSYVLSYHIISYYVYHIYIISTSCRKTPYQLVKSMHSNNNNKPRISMRSTLVSWIPNLGKYQGWPSWPKNASYFCFIYQVCTYIIQTS